jgi:DNA topoisomerase-3
MIPPAQSTKSGHSDPVVNKHTLASDGKSPDSAEYTPTDFMDRDGLGTPATRAGIIEKLIKAGYIERKKRQLIPTEKAIALMPILPDSIKSPAMTMAWEYKLKLIERSETPTHEFMTGIEALTRALVAADTAPKPETGQLFAKHPTGAVVGKCPRCGADVIETPKAFRCSNTGCTFTLWKDNRFFAAKKKKLDKKAAAALLSKGRVSFPDLWSEKKHKTYAADIVLDDKGGKYVNFTLEFKHKKP